MPGPAENVYRTATGFDTDGTGPIRATRSALPLRDLLVVDLSRALAGPHAAMMLGDLGARVVKVENPLAGDDSRHWGPPFCFPDGAARESTYFLAANRNKESIAIDLKSERGRETLTNLIRCADVLVENFRTGVLDRLGFSFEQMLSLNPRLVALSITGFGHDGPEGGRAGYDQIAQGEAGLMSVTGPDPDDVQRVGVPIADLLAGMYGAYGVLAALYEREATGRGQIVRTSLLAAVVGVHGYQGTAWTVGGHVGHAQGNHHPSISPYGLFRCKDGAVQIACGNEGLWRRLCDEMGLDAGAENMSSNTERLDHPELVRQTLETAFAGETPQSLLVRLDRAGVPAGRVRTIDEVYEWNQTRSQGLVIDVDHQTLGSLSLPGPPLRFFDHLGQERLRPRHQAPPTLDHHGESLRREFGLSESLRDVAELG
jgi:crotonobetainyl-CoA:carnitine CoA-transferase CaiB-like acyl-CoA transferase